MRKEDIFSIALKLYSITIIFSIVSNYLYIKFSITPFSHLEKLSSYDKNLSILYNLWMITGFVLLIFAIYIWYRADKILKSQSTIDFKWGISISLGFYWVYKGLFALYKFPIYYEIGYPFKWHLCFNGFLFLIIGSIILCYSFKHIERLR